MKINLTLFSIAQFALIGTYGFCWLTFTYCDVFARIKSAGSFLVLSVSNLAVLCLLCPIAIGLFDKQISIQLFPFLSVLWLLGFCVYYLWCSEIDQEKKSKEDLVPKALKLSIVLMSIITFFFRLEGFRNLFFVTAAPAGNENFIRRSLGADPTLWGQIVIIALGSLVVFGHAKISWKFFRKRRHGRLLAFGSLFGFFIAAYDVGVLMGAIDYVPLTGLAYLPSIAYFLSLAFGAPYFEAYNYPGTQDASMNPANTNLKFRNSIAAKEIETMVSNIIGILNENYGKAIAHADLRVDENFVLKGEKADAIVLFYNLLEKAFSCAKERNDDKGRIKVSFTWEESPVILIQNNGPSWWFNKNGEDRLHLERSLSLKNGFSLFLEQSGEMRSYILRAES